MKKKVLCLVDSYPSDNNKKLGSFYQDQFYILKSNFDIEVIVLDGEPTSLFKWFKQKYRFVSTEFDEKAEVLVHRYIVYNPFFDKWLRNFSKLNRFILTKHIELISNEVARFCFENLKNKPDTIYIQTCQYLIPFAAPLKKKLKTRLVGMEHYPIFAQMTNLWNVDDEFRQLVLCSSQEIDSFLTVSNYLSSVMSNFGFRNKFEVIGNFISDHAIIENIKQKDFVVLYIGYQFHLKDPKTFFQAIQNIKCYDPTIKFIIVNVVDSFNDMVNYYDVADVVDMRYKLSHDEVINIMQQEASVLVSTSTAETFGMSMAEAIVCGLPVICTNSGGNLDFATKNNCLMVDKKSPVQIADFVVALKKRDYSFNALENRNVLLNQFGCDAFKSRLIVHFTN
jgi:glycosyltransferase involved in cell wall biosynthesis